MSLFEIVIVGVLLFGIVIFSVAHLTGFASFDFFNPVFLLTSLGRMFISINFDLNIDSPQNITYNFNVSSNYTINLNVSSNRNITTWRFTLEDLRHNTIVNQSVVFTPNITINAVRWSNRLTVFGNDSAGNSKNSSVVFYINVSNSAPIIENLSNKYVCEASYLSYLLNVSDVDEDIPSSSIFPSNPFYITFSSSFNLTKHTYEIFSGTLSKTNAGGINNGSKLYQENISVNDGQYVDSRNINITIIEINNAPQITNIGVKTVWLIGDNTTFYYKVNVSDTEDGNGDSGNLTFNISGTNLFNISSNGIMNFTPNSSQIGVYNISVCIIDNGIKNPHENISLCNQNGSNITSCNNFSLTVTNANRPPQVTFYSPSNLSLNASEGDTLYFNLTGYDPDGTIPDVYWYVDDLFKKYGTGSFNYTFNYTFNCTDEGNHSIIGKITDGVLNSSYDYVLWNISILDSSNCTYCGNGVCSNTENCATCSVDCGSCISFAGGGGGGGGGGITCQEKWGCNEWGQCKSLDSLINDSSKENIKKKCFLSNWNNSFCGFQERNCRDLKNCKTNLIKPDELRECYFTPNPDCNDGIKNCHDGSCEVLIDCGGPCKACPTCSDGIKNQNEEGVDCGGGCRACRIEIPKKVFNYTIYIFLFLFFIVLITIIKLMRDYYLRKNKYEKLNFRKV